LEQSLFPSEDEGTVISVKEVGNDELGATFLAGQHVCQLKQLVAGGDGLNFAILKGSLEDEDEGFGVEGFHYFSGVVCS
jgi:hypothetical protein